MHQKIKLIDALNPANGKCKYSQPYLSMPKNSKSLIDKIYSPNKWGSTKAHFKV